MLFHKRKKYTIDTALADATLQNIFEECHRTPNTIPFDKLLLRQKAATKKYNILLAWTAVILALTAVLPIIAAFV
jgi:hypothetical protein